MDKAKVLIIDDEEAIRESLIEIFQEEGYTTFAAESAKVARELLSTEVSVIILDIKLGEDNGIDLLKEIKKGYPQIPVIMISGHGTVSLTAEAFKAGAHEFMEKPLRLIQVRACVRNAIESYVLKNRVVENEKEHLPKPIYKSHLMKELYQQTERLASINETVVIMGPSGSGKELVAQSLHYNGKRRNGPFIITNAASLPVNLAEDEIFGHEKGAFTGAHARRKGALENADGGTLFLDEIADLDIQIQAKLLRVLETGQFTRLGGSELISVDVRIISATHKDLTSLVKDGTFRQDLWYRLSAFVLTVPGLDKRKEDINLLAEDFLQKSCRDIGVKRVFSENAMNKLTNNNYAGNVRELKHVVTRSVVFSDTNEISESAVELALGGENTSHSEQINDYSEFNFRDARYNFEKDYFSAVLKKNCDNVTSSAASIGMAQSNLSRKLKELGLRK